MTIARSLHAARQKAEPTREPARPAPAARASPAGDLALARALGNRGYARYVQAKRVDAPGEEKEEEIIQRAENGGKGPSDAAVRAAAAEGVSTPSGRLPYLDRIQASFGRHSLGHVKGHVGDGATRASLAMDALAFAAGDHVVFAGTPDLQTAAHEAAHVIQQQAGVQLPGGVGRAGDAYERHADAVADAVVAGRSAEGLLEPSAASRLPAKPGTAAVPAVQHLLIRGEKPRGKYAKELWNKLRIHMIWGGLSPHGALQHYTALVRWSKKEFPSEEAFIAYFLKRATNEAKRTDGPRRWTRLLRHNRPAWPRSYKLRVEKGQDIRHIVRNATLKDAIVGEWKYQLRRGEGRARKVMSGIAKRMGIKGNYSTSFEWTNAIYRIAYLNLANLFFGAGATNRVIGLAADPLANLASELITSGKIANTAKDIEKIFKKANGILKKLENQMKRQAGRMERESAETFLERFGDFVKQGNVYLDNLKKRFLESLPDVSYQSIGEELEAISANFGFDLPNSSIPQSNMETLLETEKFLASYQAGNASKLADVLVRFVSLQPAGDQ